MPIELDWRRAPLDLQPYAAGFVERTDRELIGESVEFPLAAPLLHFMLGADYSFRTPAGLEAMPRASVWGSAATARRTLPQGRVKAFVVVLTFHGAALLCRGHPAPLADRRLELDPLLDRAWRSLPERLAEAEGLAGRAAIASSWLRDLVSRRLLGATPTSRICQAIVSHRLRGSVAEVADAAAVTERTFRNRCHREIGWSPKHLLRVARLHRVIRALHPSPWGERPVEDVRLEYFDEAHLSRDFRSLTSLSPGEYLRGKRSSGDGLVHGFVSGPPRLSGSG